MKFNKVCEEQDVRLNNNNYAKMSDFILNKFDSGTLLIDFAVNPKNEKQLKLEVEFIGDCIWLFGNDKTKHNQGSERVIKKFDSTKDFIMSLTKSIYSINQDVDKNMVKNNLFDPESFNAVIKQIYEFAEEYPNKIKSLQHNNGQWDLEIKFRRSLRRLSGIKFPNDKSSKYVIYPAISGENKWGRIVSPGEKEKLDPSLWERILRF